MWVIAYSQVLGELHRQNGTPCQDVAVAQLLDDGSAGVAIVCDGAGSAEFSDVGARLVANFCKQAYIRVLSESRWNSDAPLPTQQEWAKISSVLLRDARDHLRAHAQQHDINVCSLACTVIVTLFTRSGILLSHVGDGRAGCRLTDGTWAAIMTPCRGEEANSTIFITSDAVTSFDEHEFCEHRSLPGSISCFCIMTDGVEKAAFECNILDDSTNCYSDPNRPFPGFLDPNTRALERLAVDNASQEAINTAWACFLESGNPRLRAEPDDKAMCLGVWTDDVKAGCKTATLRPADHAPHDSEQAPPSLANTDSAPQDRHLTSARDHSVS